MARRGNGHVQELVRDWWGREPNLRRRTIGCAHLREHNKEADEWAGKRPRCLKEDETNVVWSDVTGICGFLDGCFRDDVCGAAMWINMFTPTLGSPPQKMRPSAW